MTAGKQAHLGAETFFKSQFKDLEFFCEAPTFCFGNAKRQTAPHTTAFCQRHVLFDSQVRGGACHRVLKNATHVFCSLEVFHASHISSGDLDRSRIWSYFASNGVEHSRFSSTIGTDHRHKIAVI